MSEAETEAPTTHAVLRSERAYRSLLALYPRDFRAEYGDDLAQLFRDQCHDGFDSRWRVYWRCLVDLALTVPNQHVEAIMHRNANPILVVVYAVVAVGGVVLALVGGANAATFVIGAVVAVGAGALALTTLRRAAPVRQVGISEHWWKFLLAVPVLVGAIIVGAGMGVSAWSLGMIVVLVAIGFAVVGVVLGVSHLWNRRLHSAS